MTTHAMPQTVETPAPQRELLVDIERLWTTFGQGQRAFSVHQDLNLQVFRGDILSLVGGSGTGKTVLLRHILGLTRPSQGAVKINGQNAADRDAATAASRMGMLFQHGALFSAFSVLENIAFPLREQGALPLNMVFDAAMVKLQMVGLKPEHAFRMPADLSGGMIKRVALARALIMDPPLLLLDEPTAGLDPRGSDEFCELLLELHEELGLTVIMVTHDLDTLYALSTTVAVLAEKKVIINAPPRQVVQYEHPFIQQFFLGERGLRALEPASALPTRPSTPDGTSPAPSHPPTQEP
ncbi:phospholipid/cholesterol/gamma-HCH transport system ATP-binding protein [Lampropedia hyalina DSM 16112]|jgi:phospholipid/cholesterol/gamma-HCH transport system ATP-binding protein|uniref:Phospholipid/cholesterol/gamma-HCH transport system ATP-binding protein n=1 Tax=Lampropedia hyalina DSM 16112 TaxID=1122156 RepID=A0A1M4XBV9_9BURK|nr:ATP-binding cassette domain-containing protein [Lampropedia hyalina]SHE91029.1 phospholipid/cholesterol/gamma-HCH transport system ATP-binding protein [Lampropedia hyalina DSM 16112]